MTIWSLLSIDFKTTDIFKFYRDKLSENVISFISFDIAYSSNMMLDFDNYANGTVYNYSSAICKYLFLIKSLIAWDLKNELFEKLISDTNTLTAPNDDPYEDPPSLKKVTINRHKARK